ncbi:hypothetical protein [Pseudomonas phage vB_PsaM_M1]|nr:hypothetical protein [Pseudomonas phage vB_PsaM_M1]
MKVSEFIKWLETQPQEADVEVLSESCEVGFDGESEFSYTYVSEKNVESFGHMRCSYNKKYNILLLGERE